MRKKKPKMKVSIRISDMLRLEGENIFSIGAALEIRQLLREYEKFEEKENELIAYLKKNDPYAFIQAAEIDRHQDELIARVLELAFMIGAENQKSNHLLNNYDPVYLREVIAERRKRKRNQYELFKERSEDRAKDIKRKEKSVERINYRVSHQISRQSARISEATLAR